MTRRRAATKPAYKRSWWRRFGWGTFLVVLVALRLAAEWNADSAAIDEPLTERVYRVRYVIDGDTLLLENGAKVRLQGVDTPETVRRDAPVEPWGREATEYARQFVRRAEGQVRLEFGAERIDRYNRWLAFVWHEDKMLNEDLVQAGLAFARLDYRYSGRMKRRLQDAQREAKRAERGIWSSHSPRAEHPLKNGD